MKSSLLATAVLAVAVLSSPMPGLAQDSAGRGELLYEGQCTKCHDKSVHNRESRRAKTYADIVAQVRRWSATIGSGFSDEDVNDIASYLNARYYRYSCPAPYCKQTGGLPGSTTGSAKLARHRSN